jgi:polysaccharide export outer membrane protein
MRRLRPTILRARSLFAAAALTALAACAAAPPPVPVGEEIPIAKTTFSFDKEKLTQTKPLLYLVAQGDQLDVLFQIRTWVERENFRIAVDHSIEIKFVHAPELNQEQRVRPDGNISMPYIGDVYVIGKSVKELSDELKEKYSPILRNTQLYVVIPDFRSAIKELKADLHTAPRGLSRLITVRPDGYVTFPMLGDVMVAGRAIPEINKELNEKYEKYLPGLNCDLFLEAHSGSVVYVQGMVKSPGAYPIQKPISVLEAITLAGSWTPNAQLDSVIVVRKQPDKLVATRVDLGASLDLSGNGSFFYLQPDDIVLVPQTRLSRAAEVMRSIMDILLFRGWNVSLSYGLENISVID